MAKRIALVIIFVIIMVMISSAIYTRYRSFSCLSKFSVVRNINTVNTRSEGLMFVDFSDEQLLINIDGLLTHNNKKYIISRTIKLHYKSYNDNANLYKTFRIQTTRDDSDNVNDEIANDLLFGGNTKEKIIYIKKVNDDVILFGNHTFPQYGCKRR